MIICACYDDNSCRVADLDTRLNDCNSSELNIQWNISRELPFHKIWELRRCWIDLIACLAAPPSVVPSPRSQGQFLSSCVFSPDLDLLFAHYPNNKESFNSESKIHQLREYTTSNWQVVKLSINFGRICHGKNWPKFFSLEHQDHVNVEAFLFSIYFCLCICRFVRKKQNCPVQEKCRKTWVADESLWECVCDQMQCRIVMPSDFLRLNNNNN